jgi:predicted SAM-dependent methyltransferase/SAM-dependent methyltransferase
MTSLLDRKIKTVVRQVLNWCGLEVRRLRRPGFQRRLPSLTHLEVGCGDTVREGFNGCDMRQTAASDLVCQAWEISKFCKDLKHIYSRHMLEHLCFAEVEHALRDWNRSLAVGGVVEIVVPNMAFHVRQFLNIEWEGDLSFSGNKDLAWALAGFHGWQRGCEELNGDSRTKYWDVHKSSFTEQLLRFFLESAGFEDVKTWIEDECHLCAMAVKAQDKAERQVAPRLAGIRVDHRARYEFACGFVEDGDVVLDAACGVGYGTALLSSGTNAGMVHGVDLNEAAVAYARRHYLVERTQFSVGDAVAIDFANTKFDVVVSFETIEHLDASGFLRNIRGSIAAGGKLICSTPNEEVLRFSRENYPHHLRHYTPQQFEELLRDSGFEVEGRFSQADRESSEITHGWTGAFLIAVCRKSPLIANQAIVQS